MGPSSDEGEEEEPTKETETEQAWGRGENRVHGILESRGRKCFKEEQCQMFVSVRLVM